MTFELDKRMVIGVASSALFDLEESDRIFKVEGVESYRTFQIENAENTLNPGVAFHFVRRILELNDLNPDDPLVEVVVLSRNSPETGIRIMNSIREHKLPISRAVFRGGKSPYEFIDSFEMCLFLSANSGDINAAIEKGYPAGLVIGKDAQIPKTRSEITIAFDFDAVLASDASEKIYKSAGGLAAFKENELINKKIPMDPGPLKNFLSKLNRIQDIEETKSKINPDYLVRLRVVLVTARQAPAHERAINTIRSWGLKVDEAYFLGGIEKSKVLNVIKPLIFFDDQRKHFENLEGIAAVHIPFGVSNEQV